jgi:hypothetical protein
LNIVDVAAARGRATPENVMAVESGRVISTTHGKCERKKSSGALRRMFESLIKQEEKLDAESIKSSEEEYPRMV